MPDAPPDHATVCPPGCALVERIGWEDDGKFRAVLTFPSGPPDIPLSIVWGWHPVRIVVVEESDNASELTIDLILAAVRRALARTERIAYKNTLPMGQQASKDCSKLRAALAILEAARAWRAAWGTPAIHAAEQDLDRAIQGESC